MVIDYLLGQFQKNNEKEFIAWKNQSFTYDWLLNRLAFWQQYVDEQKIKLGAVVALEADFSPNSIALFLALTENRCIIIPLTSSVKAKKDEFIEIAQGQILISVDENDSVSLSRFQNDSNHEYFQKLRELEHPGLVLFSSGTTGKSKAAVHDMSSLLTKYTVQRKVFRTITFLLYDHIGGINTMFYTLSNGGCIITVPERSPDAVLQTVEKYKVELLPTSPTFLNLMLLSEAYKRYDLGSLLRITYGTEPMPESLLKRVHELFPQVQLIQTYGLSELGILSSKSKSSDSLWVKIGGEGFETRIVNGILQIKAQSAMLGYLNAPSPFTEDGWFHTGDSVEVDGDYVKILGRLSEIINVGGEKVYPAEIESVIQEFPNVAEVTVYGEKNPITGNIVCAKLRLKVSEDPKEFITKLKKYCRGKLQSFKIPVKIKIVDETQYSERFKKTRKV